MSAFQVLQLQVLQFQPQWRQTTPDLASSRPTRPPCLRPPVSLRQPRRPPRRPPSQSLLTTASLLLLTFITQVMWCIFVLFFTAYQKYLRNSARWWKLVYTLTNICLLSTLRASLFTMPVSYAGPANFELTSPVNLFTDDEQGDAPPSQQASPHSAHDSQTPNDEEPQ